MCLLTSKIGIITYVSLLPYINVQEWRGFMGVDFHSVSLLKVAYFLPPYFVPPLPLETSKKTLE